jgi:hypothetical protein
MVLMNTAGFRNHRLESEVSASALRMTILVEFPGPCFPSSKMKASQEEEAGGLSLPEPEMDKVACSVLQARKAEGHSVELGHC